MGIPWGVAFALGRNQMVKAILMIKSAHAGTMWKIIMVGWTKPVSWIKPGSGIIPVGRIIPLERAYRWRGQTFGKALSFAKGKVFAGHQGALSSRLSVCWL